MPNFRKKAGRWLRRVAAISVVAAALFLAVGWGWSYREQLRLQADIKAARENPLEMFGNEAGLFVLPKAGSERAVFHMVDLTFNQGAIGLSWITIPAGHFTFPNLLRNSVSFQFLRQSDVSLWTNIDRTAWNGQQRLGYQCSGYISPWSGWIINAQPIGIQRWFGVPAWMASIPLFSAAGLILRHWVVTWRRPRAGCCPACGYDLRASHEGCPECGHVTDAPAPVTNI